VPLSTLDKHETDRWLSASVKVAVAAPPLEMAQKSNGQRKKTSTREHTT